VTPLARLPLLLLALMTLTAALPAPVAAEGQPEPLVLRGPRAGDQFVYHLQGLGENESYNFRYRWVGVEGVRDAFDQPLSTLVLEEVWTICWQGWGCDSLTQNYHVDPATTAVVARTGHDEERYGLYVLSQPFLLGHPEVRDYEKRTSFVVAWISAMGRTWAAEEEVTSASRLDADGVAETKGITARAMDGSIVLDDGVTRLHYDGAYPWPVHVIYPEAPEWSFHLGEVIEGSDPLPWRTEDVLPPRTSWAGAPRANYTRDGPQETFLERWPLQEAADRARQNAAVANWMKAHPDAYLVSAVGQDNTRTVTWLLEYAEGTAVLRITLEHSRNSLDPHAPAITLTKLVAPTAYPDIQEIVGRPFACGEHSRQLAEERLYDGLLASVQTVVMIRVEPALSDVACRTSLTNQHTDIDTDGIAIRNRHESKASVHVRGATGGIVSLSDSRSYDRLGL